MSLNEPAAPSGHLCACAENSLFLWNEKLISLLHNFIKNDSFKTLDDLCISILEGFAWRIENKSDARAYSTSTLRVRGEVEGSCQRNHRTHQKKNSLTLIVSVVFDDDNIMMTTCHFLFKWRDMFDRTHTHIHDDAESQSFSPRNGRKSSFGRKSFARAER